LRRTVRALPRAGKGVLIRVFAGALAD